MKQISEEEVLKEMIEYLGADSERRNVKYFTDEYNPSDNSEPTLDQLKTYCNRRGMVIMTFDLFNEMKSRWSEVVKHGHWISHGSYFTCSVCGEEQYGVDTGRYYCPNCGAKMDEEEE